MKIMIVLFALTPLSALAGETIGQKEGWASYERMLAEKVTTLNGTCGSKVSAAFDKKSYPSFDPMKDRTEAACRDVMNALATVCSQSPAGKDGVQRITRVTCRYNEARTGLVLSGSELIVDISPTNTGIVGKEKGSYSWQAAIKELL